MCETFVYALYTCIVFELCDKKEQSKLFTFDFLNFEKKLSGTLGVAFTIELLGFLS